MSLSNREFKGILLLCFEAYKDEMKCNHPAFMCNVIRHFIRFEGLPRAKGLDAIARIENKIYPNKTLFGYLRDIGHESEERDELSEIAIQFYQDWIDRLGD